MLRKFIELKRKTTLHLKKHGFISTAKKISSKIKKQEDLVGTSNFYDKQSYSYIENLNTGNLIKNIKEFTFTPMFSIVVPVYNVAPKWLDKAIESIKKQLYTNWELCLVDDCSTNSETVAYLNEIDHEKIRVKFLKENQNISGATNEALAMANGEYIVFMDNDDEITKDALYELALAINQNNSPDMLYSDEDKIDTLGNTSDPFFKPDWSPDTFMSIMYICHLTCYKKSIVDKLGGLRKGYEGAQDYDLGLRFMEISDSVVHIPKVLYHWRMLETSIASNMSSKNYAVESLKKAKEDALKRRGLKGELLPVKSFPGQYIVSYRNEAQEKISIIIPTKDKMEVLKVCIDSILEKTTYKNYEIILVNNQSKEEKTLNYFKELEREENISIIDFDEPFNFSKMNNVAAKRANGEFFLFLNNDTEVITENWLEEMLGYASLKHIGAVGAKLLFPKTGNIQHCGIVNLNDGPSHAFYNSPDNKTYHFGRNSAPYNYIAVTGACLMVHTNKFYEVNGFDELLPVAYNDVDICFSLREANYFNVNLNHIALIHYESVSRGADHEDKEKSKRLEKERKRLYSNHSNFYYKDPFFNPNLHPNSPYFKSMV